MNLNKHYFLSLFLISSLAIAQDQTDSRAVLGPDDIVHGQSSVLEWEKFKRFERQLASAQKPEPDKDGELRDYARDSLRILGVKLMAMRFLEEKALLDRDISENPDYYTALLDALQESGIPKNEYRFLEEKMALFNQLGMERQLVRSRWWNMVLLILCLALLTLSLRLYGRRQKTHVPELSKQEATVRNLILQGKSNKEIAKELFISLSTVKTHITSIYGKLNVTNRQQLVKNGTGTST